MSPMIQKRLTGEQAAEMVETMTCGECGYAPQPSEGCFVKHDDGAIEFVCPNCGHRWELRKVAS